MSYRLRKFLCAIVLLVGLPLYVVVSLTVIGWFERPPFLLELAIYVALGILWALPFRSLFRGIGQPDPDAPRNDQR